MKVPKGWHKVNQAAFLAQMQEASEMEARLHKQLIEAGFTCIGGCYTAPPGMTTEQLEEVLR